MKDLDTYRFKLNPYDPYIAKIVINGKAMKVVCQVDDLKVSHVYSFEITNTAGYLSTTYKGLRVHCGKVDDYMNMDFANEKNINMFVPELILV